MKTVVKILLSILFVFIGILGAGAINMADYFPGRILFSLAIMVAGIAAAVAIWKFSSKKKDGEGDVFKDGLGNNTLNKD